MSGTCQDLGRLFRLTGRIFFGISPVDEILRFNTSWTQLVKGVIGKDGKEEPPTLVEKKEESDHFKRSYPHTVWVSEAEMRREGATDDKTDSSTTRIDAAMLLTVDINNIVDALFRIPPTGIVFAQVNAASEGAFNNYVRERTWEEFRGEDKLSQDSPFVLYVIREANKVLTKLGIGMEVSVVELKYFRLTPTSGNEELEKSQTLLLINENKGDAEVALAKRQKEADKIRGEGRAASLNAVKEVVGESNIGTYAALEQVKETELRVYGGNKEVVPVIDTEGGGK